MKLVVLVPSEEFKNLAGVRIRYRRIAAAMARQDITLSVEDISSFDPKHDDCDILLISKCHDARSLIAAAVSADRGKIVGVDLFDNYFSDAGDSRLIRYREWLGVLSRICHFALCSTDEMRAVVAKYQPGLPTHILNDPAPDHDIGALSGALVKKLEYAREERSIHVAWFGMGDNPYFDVGLTDLRAFGTQLKDLERRGFAVELVVMTNRRALTANRLSLLRELPVPTQVREWSETGERELLQESLIVFLPVSAQPFSTAKSLNRAITALSFGCQVLSVGYPLYEVLNSLIYRDTKTLVEDVLAGSLRLGPQSIETLSRAFHEFASADIESRGLATFLQSLDRREEGPVAPLRLVHGHSTRGEAHDFVRALDGLSVASPFCGAPLDFDVIFRDECGILEMLVTRETSQRLVPSNRFRLKADSRIKGRHYFSVDKKERAQTPLGGSKVCGGDTVSMQLATYASVMTEIERRLTDAFGAARTFISETSQLPFFVPEFKS